MEVFTIKFPGANGYQAAAGSTVCQGLINWIKYLQSEVGMSPTLVVSQLLSLSETKLGLFFTVNGYLSPFSKYGTEQLEMKKELA